jgi:putative solute:sodium symporter small subunit
MESPSQPTATGTGASRSAELEVTPYWRFNRAWVAALLLVWAIATFGVPWLAAQGSMRIAGWPLGFWACAQGLPLLYLVLAGLYAGVMARRERHMQAQRGKLGRLPTH